jgi:hypothetical protein
MKELLLLFKKQLKSMTLKQLAQGISTGALFAL